MKSFDDQKFEKDLVGSENFFVLFENLTVLNKRKRIHSKNISIKSGYANLTTVAGADTFTTSNDRGENS